LGGRDRKRRSRSRSRDGNKAYQDQFNESYANIYGVPPPASVPDAYPQIYPQNTYTPPPEVPVAPSPPSKSVTFASTVDLNHVSTEKLDDRVRDRDARADTDRDRDGRRHRRDRPSERDNRRSKSAERDDGRDRDHHHHHSRQSSQDLGRLDDRDRDRDLRKGRKSYRSHSDDEYDSSDQIEELPPRFDRDGRPLAGNSNKGEDMAYKLGQTLGDLTSGKGTAGKLFSNIFGAGGSGSGRR
jgi:hypothetical protein